MVTTYAAQPIQELIQVMVPQTQTLNTIQTINKVTKYAHTPVNAYSYAGPTTSMPMTTGMPMTTRACGESTATPPAPCTGLDLPDCTGVDLPADIPVCKVVCRNSSSSVRARTPSQPARVLLL